MTGCHFSLNSLTYDTQRPIVCASNSPPPTPPLPHLKKKNIPALGWTSQPLNSHLSDFPPTGACSHNYYVRFHRPRVQLQAADEVPDKDNSSASQRLAPLTRSVTRGVLVPRHNGGHCGGEYQLTSRLRDRRMCSRPPDRRQIVSAEAYEKKSL